jgi:beta-phosphoglucomutase-like phosphatase (HAD superfamily)/dTDP-glucose pyrophosphorylase
VIPNKLVIFDLDGVLIDSRMIHFIALNRALDEVSPTYPISWQEHLAKYDGLPTTKKLLLLTKEKGLDAQFYDMIWKSKQRHTVELYQDIKPNLDLQCYFDQLKFHQIQIAVASNSIRQTMVMALSRLGVMEQIDFFVSNEDVRHPKPFPEIFWKCMIALKTDIKNTVIIEDSHIGREGAIASGAHLIPVRNQDDVTQGLCESIIEYFDGQKTQHIPWRNNKMNIVIPMAGHGSRFAQAGYTFPKPLIEVNEKPMIQLVVENLNIEAHYIFIVQKEHYEKYQLLYMLNLIAPGCDIVQVEGVTEGAACTTLLAKELINNDDPLLIANSDQYIEWNSNECLYAFTADGIDAGILTFKSVHPKWSYARLDDQGFVAEVAEKRPISDNATVGVYYWKRGADYVKYAEQMIQKNIRTNNEFYVCPVFNEAIGDGKKVRVKEIAKMWGIGTPEDLKTYLEHHV